MSKKTTQTQQTHTVSTPTNPAWVDSGLAGVGQKISDLGTLDPYSLIAGTNPLIDQAAQGASQLGTSDNYGAALHFGGKDPKENGGAFDGNRDRLGVQPLASVPEHYANCAGFVGHN